VKVKYDVELPKYGYFEGMEEIGKIEDFIIGDHKNIVFEYQDCLQAGNARIHINYRTKKYGLPIKIKKCRNLVIVTRK